MMLCLLHPADAQQAEIVLPIGHSSKITHVYYSSDGKMILCGATGWDSGIEYQSTIWDVASGNLIRAFPGKLVSGFSSDDKMIVTQIKNDSLVIWNIGNGKALGGISKYSDFFLETYFSNDNRKLIINADNAIELWSIDSLKLSYQQFNEGDVAFSPYLSFNMKYVLFSGLKGDTCFTTIRELSTGRLLNTFPSYYDPEGMSSSFYIFSPICPEDPVGARYVLIKSMDGKAELWECEGTMKYRLNDQEGQVNCASFSADGKYFIIGWDDHILRMYDTETGTIIKTFTGHDNTVVSANFNPDGTRLLTTDYSEIMVWNVKNGKIIYRLDQVDEHFYAEFSPPCTDDPLGGKYIAAINGMDYDLRFWETKTGKFIGQADGWVYSKNGLFSPDGKILNTCNDDGEVMLWYCETGENVHILKSQGKKIKQAMFSPGGKEFIIEEDDGLKSWNCSNLKQKNCFRWESDSSFHFCNEVSVCLTSIKSLKYSPVNEEDPKGGRYFITTGTDHNYKVWNNKSDKVVLSFPDSFYNSVDFDDQGKYIIAKGYDGARYLEIFDLSDGQQVISLKSENLNFDKVALCSNGQKMMIVYTSFLDFLILVYNIKSGETIFKYSGEWMFENAWFSPASAYDPSGGHYLFVVTRFKTLMFDLESGKIAKDFEVNRIKVNTLSPDGKYLVTGFHTNYLWDVVKGEIISTFDTVDEITDLAFSPDSKIFLYITEGSVAEVRESLTGKLLHKFPVLGWEIADINWKDSILMTYDYCVLSFYNFLKAQEVMKFISMEDDQYIAVTPDMYYLATKNAARKISWRIGTKLFSFDQYDLQYNRPDLVIKQLWNPDTVMIKIYRKMYEMRMLKSGFNEKMLIPQWNQPEIKVINKSELSVVQSKKSVTLQIIINGKGIKVERLNIRINGVPIYGRQGQSLKENRNDSFSVPLTLELSEGPNIIELSCTNEAGVESVKEGIHILCTGSPKRHNTYLIIMGVSSYKNPLFDLKYAVKDGRDVAELFKFPKSTNDSKLIADTLFDRNATKSNFLRLKKKLLKSKVDDEVIVFLSGHGLLNEKLDFYYATYDIDFATPDSSGISFSDLENVFDGIPARKKMLLMDACHSGEVDTGSYDQSVSLNANMEKDIVFRGEIREYSYDHLAGQEANSGISQENTFDLMQEMCSNMDKGTGTVIISAAAGKGYALESPEWNNGVFTFCIINGIRNLEADTDEDGKVNVSELQEYTIRKVQEMTNGMQKPTARKEIWENNWIIR